MEEMGIDAPVEAVTSFVYRAHDDGTGLTEHELDHVLIGRFDGTCRT
jgi:isopentenyl-diphosphate delta-isomerase